MDHRWMRFDELTAAQLYDLLASRQDVFIVEQASAYRDLDGRDPSCWHLAVRAEPDGPLASYARVRGAMAGEPAFIGRFAVARAWRGRSLGRRMVAECLRFMEQHHPGQDIEIGAQSHLQAFYESFGFVREGEEYDDGGIPHVTSARHDVAARRDARALTRATRACG